MDAIIVRGTEYPKEMLIEMGIETKTPVFGSIGEMAYAYRSDSPDEHYSISDLVHHGDFDAVSGIATPGRFFEGLEQVGLSIEKYAFPDHHAFTASDVSGLNRVITTEKDAVKLVHLLTETILGGWASKSPTGIRKLAHRSSERVEKGMSLAPQLKGFLVCPPV